MATLAELSNSGEIVPISVGEDIRMSPRRLIYGSQKIIGWLENELPAMKTRVSSILAPLEQVDALFEEFQFGKPLGHPRQFRQLRLRSQNPNVWELKTPDIRIFGWFPKKDIFVAICAEDATHIKDHDLYSGLIEEVVRFRGQLKLDEPKTLIGDIDDVLSN